MKAATWISVITAGIILIGCATVPLTGRKQLNLVSSNQLNQLASDQYAEVLRENRVIRGTPDAERVHRVGHELANASTSYLRQNGHEQLLDELNLNWEFNLIENDQVNAWCMPGGKVAFYTGIMPFFENDAQLAAVMGHEIAHAIARHSNERMSQALVASGGQLAGNIALQDNPNSAGAFNMLYGIGAQVGYMLPNSRRHEAEADHLGLIFMAMAGYNPNEALAFWKRMQADSGSRPPEFLSTHPAPDTRIRNLQKLIPEAMEYYNPR